MIEIFYKKDGQMMVSQSEADFAEISYDSVVWIDELIGRKSGDTFLTLVAVRTCSMATGTITTDVAVGEELFGLFVVELF